MIHYGYCPLVSLLSLTATKQRQQRQQGFLPVTDLTLVFSRKNHKQRQERQQRRDIIINTHAGALNKDRIHTHICVCETFLSLLSLLSLKELTR